MHYNILHAVEFLYFCTYILPVILPIHDIELVGLYLITHEFDHEGEGVDII